jgi:hypothetical protein
LIGKHCWDVTSLRMRKQHGHKEITVTLLCDVTAYAEVCLPIRSVETVLRSLEMAVFVAQSFLHGANTPQYSQIIQMKTYRVTF